MNPITQGCDTFSIANGRSEIRLFIESVTTTINLVNTKQLRKRYYGPAMDSSEYHAKLKFEKVYRLSLLGSTTEDELRLEVEKISNDRRYSQYIYENI